MTEPRVTAILETALYVDDLSAASRFYETVFGLQPLFADERLVAYDVGGRSVLLLFRRGASTGPSRTPGGIIPPHDGSGPAHFAFAIRAEDVDAWRRSLADAGIEIESEVRWARGGVSVYLRDPDGHAVELATPGLWSIY